MIIDPSTLGAILFGLPQTTLILRGTMMLLQQLVTAHWSEAGCFQIHFGPQFQNANGWKQQ